MNHYYKKLMLPCLILITLLISATREMSAQTCIARSIPYVETFDTLTAPALPPCSDTLDLDGDGKSWKTQDLSGKANLRFRNENPSINEGWFFSEGVHLEKDSVYTFRCLWLAGGRSASPRIKIHWGTAQHPDSMINPPLLDNNFAAQASYDTLEADFTPSRTGTHYFGFYGYGDDAQTVGIDIAIDDIVVAPKGSILHDVAITSVMGFTANGEICADTNADLSVVVTNTGILPMANILVDVMYTGAATGARSGTITGPLLMGMSDTIVFANADLSLTGSYDFTASIIAVNDELLANDTLEISITALSDPTADSIIATATGTDGAFEFEAANPQYASDYDWDFGDGNTSNTLAPTHTYTQSGTYTITLVITNLCSSITLSKEITVEIEEDDESSVSDITSQSGISIYPNPAADWFVITSDGENSIRSISMRNSTGSLVYQNKNVKGAVRVSTNRLAAGLYLIQIETAHTLTNYKLQVL